MAGHLLPGDAGRPDARALAGGACGDVSWGAVGGATAPFGITVLIFSISRCHGCSMRDSPGGQVTRWYRGEAVNPVATVGASLVAIGLLMPSSGSSWSAQFPLHWPILVSGALILVGVYTIILNRRAGIGVRSDGVIFRSCLGREQRVPWSEIEQFKAIRTPRNRRSQMIAVICRTRKPLYTFGCWFDKTRRSRRKIFPILRALESERLAAIPDTGSCAVLGGGSE